MERTLVEFFLKIKFKEVPSTEGASLVKKKIVLQLMRGKMTERGNLSEVRRAWEGDDDYEDRQKKKLGYVFSDKECSIPITNPISNQIGWMKTEKGPIKVRYFPSLGWLSMQEHQEIRVDL